MRGRARLSPLSAWGTPVLIQRHTPLPPPPISPEKWKYKGSCAISPLERGKCRCATSLQLLVLKEDMETESVSRVLGEENEEDWGQKKR